MNKGTGQGLQVSSLVLSDSQVESPQCVASYIGDGSEAARCPCITSERIKFTSQVLSQCGWPLQSSGCMFLHGGALSPPSIITINFPHLPTPLITFLGYLHIFLFSTTRLPRKWAVAGRISPDSSQPQASGRGWEVVQA